MQIFECKFGEGIKLLSESDEVRLVILRDKNDRIKIGIKTPDNINVHLKETYQRLQADLNQQVESYYHKVSSERKEIPITLISTKHEPLDKSKVLLVEDTEIIRKVNSNFLESLGCEVTAAQDGREAFDFLQNKQNKFDLILLDIGLPDISGIEICKWIRKHSINQKTPVIFLTAFGDKVKNKCIDAGCNDFAAKPLSMEKLQKLIRKWIPNKNNNHEE
jgi:carbon storage regulator CsrA